LGVVWVQPGGGGQRTSKQQKKHVRPRIHPGALKKLLAWVVTRRIRQRRARNVPKKTREVGRNRPGSGSNQATQRTVVKGVDGENPRTERWASCVRKGRGPPNLLKIKLPVSQNCWKGKKHKPKKPKFPDALTLKAGPGKIAKLGRVVACPKIRGRQNTTG